MAKQTLMLCKNFLDYQVVCYSASGTARREHVTLRVCEVGWKCKCDSVSPAVRSRYCSVLIMYSTAAAGT